MTDLDAHHYRNHSSAQYELAHELLEKVFLKGNEIILDVGCGDGRITAEIAKYVSEGFVTGVDRSQAMIALAQNSFPKEEYPNLTFIKGVAEELHVEKSADIILVLNTLHWIRDPWKAIHNLADSLKPNGTLLILTYPKESPYWQFLEESIKEERFHSYADQSAYQTILTTSEYQAILEHEGLVIEECCLEEKVAVNTSSAALIAYMKGWLNCYLPLPRALENSFLQRAAEKARLYSLTKNSEEIQLPYLKLTLKARKMPICSQDREIGLIN